jgi:DNA-binding NarL/FixJ family response regulator
MKTTSSLIFLTQDKGLEAHWANAFNNQEALTVNRLSDIVTLQAKPNSTLWIDLACLDKAPNLEDSWKPLLADLNLKIIATSSNPSEEEALELLDLGFMGYCHAYSDIPTLIQVNEVISSGNVWIGRNLMQRLLRRVAEVTPITADKKSDCLEQLTLREREIAVLASNGASNQAIAIQCAITERTVKAHLGTVFQKLNIADRLQLALRVHGIN